jgi:hypothetical protein
MLKKLGLFKNWLCTKVNMIKVNIKQFPVITDLL